MTRVPVALFNYENGGLQADGGYDFTPLQQARSATSPRPPR